MNIGDTYETNSGSIIEVIGYESALKVKIKFLDTGNERYSQAVDIRMGRCKDKLKPSLFGVGYAGYGDCRYNSLAGKKWAMMMRRCYDAKWKKNKPSYDGVVVCDEWHNMQNFSKWFNENYPSDGLDYDLDKDNLSGDCKIYSPETCRFISHYENVSLTAKGGFKMISPSGQVVDISNAKKFCVSNGIDRSNLNKVLSGKSSHCKGWRKYEGK